MKSESYFIRMAELSELADVYPDFLARLIYRGKIVADAKLKAGEEFQPLFHSERIDELVAEIKAYDRSKLKNAVEA
jgi:hypothetical protein